MGHPEDLPFNQQSREEDLSRRKTCAWRRVKLLLLPLLGLSFYCGHTFSHVASVLVAPTPPKGDLDWKACGDRYECTHVDVPLNYHGDSKATARLAVGRLLAKNQKEKLGSLFVNPGGPGGSGMSFLYRAGPMLAELLDEKYDIVSWDPRGINGTTPRVACFESQTAQDLFLSQELAIESRNLSSPVDLEILRNQVRKLDAQRQVVGALCHKQSGKALRHVGTATVVRDLELLSRKIEGEEAPINFWGFSYGTVVGSYLVNMFPTRLGKVAIDGVVDPVLWATTPSHTWPKYDFVDTEKAFTGFVQSCALAGEERCSLAKHGKNGCELSKRIQKFIDDLYLHPIPIANSETPGVLTSGGVRSILFVNMYRPRGWPAFADLLSEALSGNATPLYESIIDTVELDTNVKPQTAFAIDAVTCVDGPNLGKVKDKAVDEIVEEIVEAWDQTSKIFGTVEAGSCHHWPATETERFIGPFNHTNLSNEILVIGNTADPITPLVNAKTVNSLLPQSRLIVQDGYGHCSLAMTSLCTGKAIRGYFLDGTLPLNGLFCSTNEVLFPEKDKASVGAWEVQEGVHMSSEDLKLMQTLQNLGQAMEPELMTFKRPRSLI